MESHTSQSDAPAEGQRFTKLSVWIPIHSYEAAVAHYVDWLGFKIDWEWRQAEGQPVLMVVSRDDVTIGLGEDHTGKPSAQLGIDVSDYPELMKEWIARLPEQYVGQSETNDPGSVVITNAIGNSVVRIQFDQIRIRDPFGNILVIHPTRTPAKIAEHEANMVKVREYVQQRRDGGHEFPTIDELNTAIRPDVVRPKVFRGPDQFEITATDVLNTFPDYAEVYAERRRQSFEALQLEVVEVAPQSVLVLEQVVSLRDLSSVVPDLAERVRAYLTGNGAARTDMRPFLQYQDAAEDFTIQVGFAVETPLEGVGDIVRRDLPGGKAVAALVAGRPTMGDHSDWSTIIEYAVEQGYQFDVEWGGVGGREEYEQEIAGAGPTRVYLPIDVAP
jgi:hypothetical protein